MRVDKIEKEDIVVAVVAVNSSDVPRKDKEHHQHGQGRAGPRAAWGTVSGGAYLSTFLECL